MIDEANQLTQSMSKAARTAFAALYDRLVGTYGCDVYVKTIYVGFEICGEMVAAAYPHHDKFEVALALSEDHPDPRLKDATHLTWRTMPVSIMVGRPEELEPLMHLVDESARRITEGTHNVNRPPEHFISREGRRGGKR
jgi:hypothetical protein